MLRCIHETHNKPEDPNELNRMYLETLDAIGIPESRWESMLVSESLDRKWTLIVQNKERLLSGDLLARKCVDLLKSDDLQVADIRELRTILGTSPKSFLHKFNHFGGITAVRDVCLLRAADA